MIAHDGRENFSTPALLFGFYGFQAVLSITHLSCPFLRTKLGGKRTGTNEISTYKSETLSRVLSFCSCLVFHRNLRRSLISVDDTYVKVQYAMTVSTSAVKDSAQPT